MKNLLRASQLLYTCIAIAMSGCGGGGSDVAGIDGSGAPVDPIANDPTPVVSSGDITGFGSIIVNGIRYDTRNSNIQLNGNNSDESELAIGSIVTVTGEINSDGKTGTADTVIANINVLGPLQDVDAPKRTITVLGQTVKADESTSFEGSVASTQLSLETLGILSTSDTIEVSGYTNLDGEIEATRIALLDSTTELIVTGRISGLNSVESKFMLNALPINYELASISGTLNNNANVRVKGITDAGILRAATVTVLEPILGSAGSYIELSGLSEQSTIIPGEFSIDGVSVLIKADTQFINSFGPVSSIAANEKLEVEGRINSEGSIVADRIIFEKDSSAFMQLMGLVGSVKRTYSFTFAGTPEPLTQLSAYVLDKTIFQDKTPGAIFPYTYAEFDPLDYFKIWGTQIEPLSLNSYVHSKRIERHTPEGQVIIQSAPASREDGVFPLYKISITHSNSTTNYYDAQGNPISEIDFVNYLDAGFAANTPWIVRARDGRGDTLIDPFLATDIWLIEKLTL